MNSFAYIISPTDIGQLKQLWPMIRYLPNFIVKSSLKKALPFRLTNLKDVRSSRGNEVEGQIILCPLFSEFSQVLDESLILDKLVLANHISERLGAKIMGLGGLTSFLGDKAFLRVKAMKVPVTSGNCLAAWSVYEAVYKTTKARNIQLKDCSLLVADALTPLGNLCARKLADLVGRLIISSNHHQLKLDRLKAHIAETNPSAAIVQEGLKQALASADLVILTAGIGLEEIDLSLFKPGAVIFDISMGEKLFKPGSNRPDVSIIEAGLIKLPFPVEPGFDTGLPRNIVHASLAEVMLLALESRFVNYSLGENINLDKLEEIADIAAWHGFEILVPETERR